MSRLSKPPVFWVVDLSSGKAEKVPLVGEIGSEALRGVVEAEVAKLEIGLLKHEDLCQ